MRYKAAPMTNQSRFAPIGHRLLAWLRFFTGLAMLAVAAGFFMSGVTPPGVCGEVLRHNQAEEIDASPLFYSEVEHMAALEEGVDQLRKAAMREIQGLPITD
jgi:hypothetical protein